jgi:2,4-dienoyl-CoA reductase (NADPH2)
MRLLEPFTIGPRTARNRVVFGPHETNLGRGRAFSERHLAYYRRRAEGGAGVIIVEEASVHESDWPYERAPLASAAGAGWATIAEALHAEGALAVAALGHAGGQGSSAYSQAPLWAPSRVPEVNSREVPKWMEPEDIEAVVRGFAAAAAAAAAAGLDGVEVNAGQFSLVRQFLSGLTNLRDDAWGADKLTFARDVLTAVKEAAPDIAIGLRLSCDELAPWAGIVPEAAAEIAAALQDQVDWITVVRGAIFTVSATRPDTHAPPGFNLDLARQIKAAVHKPVIVQGSIVDVAQAEDALVTGAADAVEMTRAQIAEPDLVSKAKGGGRPRPCILCNQTCQVRDVRNPIVTCVVEPDSGYEVALRLHSQTERRDVLVVGGGVAGLECARVAALQGHRVTLAERDGQIGGMTRIAANGAGRERLNRAWEWLLAECEALGVTVETGRTVTAADVTAFAGDVVLCTGSRAGRRTYDATAEVLTAAEVLAGTRTIRGPVLVWDPIGGPIGISVAELLRGTGLAVALATPDLIPGNELSRSGDLAPANVRLQSSGVHIIKRALLRQVKPGQAIIEERFTGVVQTVPAALVVDAGYRLPEDTLWRETGERLSRAGDAVAPRTIYEAVLEGRRCGAELASRRRPALTA